MFYALFVLCLMLVGWLATFLEFRQVDREAKALQEELFQLRLDMNKLDTTKQPKKHPSMWPQ